MNSFLETPALFMKFTLKVKRLVSPELPILLILIALTVPIYFSALLFGVTLLWIVSF